MKGVETALTVYVDPPLDTTGNHLAFPGICSPTRPKFNGRLYVTQSSHASLLVAHRRLL